MGGGGGWKSLKTCRNAKKKFKIATIAAILDFGPIPKSNGMILGPYLTPPPSFVEIHRGVFPEYCSQTNKPEVVWEQTNTCEKEHKELSWQKSRIFFFLPHVKDRTFWKLWEFYVTSSLDRFS